MTNQTQSTQLTPEEIEKGNRVLADDLELLAKFEGFQKFEDCKVYDKVNMMDGKTAWVLNPSDIFLARKYIDHDSLSLYGTLVRHRFTYNNDRNELHRVWVKFRELRVNVLEEYEREYWAIVEKVAYKVAYGTLPELFTALVEAVRWWNEVKKGGER
jgi:hypothetical protein